MAWEGYTKQTQPEHIYKQPIMKFTLKNRMEIREIELRRRKAELGSIESELDQRETA